MAANPFELHLIFLDTVIGSWRPYLIFMTQQVSSLVYLLDVLEGYSLIVDSLTKLQACVSVLKRTMRTLCPYQSRITKNLNKSRIT